MLTLAIVGSRDFADAHLFAATVNAWIAEHGRPDRIVTGCARGADTYARAYGLGTGIPVTVHRADWGRGRRAGPERNAKIVADADAMVAFPIGGSRGTRDSIRRARAKGIPVREVTRPPPPA